MTDVWSCPVCPTAPELRVLDPHLLRLPLRRCDLCLGLLADPSTVAAAATHYHGSHYVMSEGHGRHHCRSCDALFDRARDRCPTCRKEQTIHCVRCLMPMDVIEVAGVSVDVCRPCRMVWFDRGELGLLSRRHASALQAGLLPGASVQGSGLDASVVDLVDAAPTVIETARIAGDATVRVVAESSSSGVVEIVVAVGDGAAELTSGAIDVLSSILEGLDF
jgi:hypothetical protein